MPNSVAAFGDPTEYLLVFTDFCLQEMRVSETVLFCVLLQNRKNHNLAR